MTEAIQQDVPVVREWIGSLDGSVNADVRARVSGYLISQNYKEGAVVKQGDLLFQVDPSVYEAAVEQAKAGVAQAEANQLQTEQTEQRETQLYQQKVESKQNLDNAVQNNTAAKAQLKAQQAAQRQAELNLEFTKITAPISGIAGIANPGIGDLVGPSDTNPLTTILMVNLIKVYFQISEQDYLKLAQDMQANCATLSPCRQSRSSARMVHDTRIREIFRSRPRGRTISNWNDPACCANSEFDKAAPRLLRTSPSHCQNKANWGIAGALNAR